MDTVTDLLSTFFVSRNEYVKKATVAKAEKNAKEKSGEKERSTVRADKKAEERKSQGVQVGSDKEANDNEKLSEKLSEKLPVKRSSLSVLIDELGIGDSDGGSSVGGAESENDEHSSDYSSDVSSLSNETVEERKQSEEEPLVEEIVMLKRFILKATEFGKRNMLIMGEDIEDLVGLLSDILHKLSLIKDVQSLYNKSIHVVTKENKKIFKKMILENPYLYFTDFNVQGKLKRDIKKDIEGSSKRTIAIFDGIESANVVSGAQTIILCKPNEVVQEVLNKLGEKTLVIFKPGRYKMAQKQFFKNVVKGNVKGFERGDFEEYYKIVSNEDADIRYLVVRDKELRYI